MSRIGKILGLMLSVFGLGPAFAANKFDQERQESGQPLFMLISDKEIADAARAAQATLQKFRDQVREGLVTDVPPMIKARFSRPNGDNMWLWLTVHALTDDGFSAEVFEAPPEFPTLTPGSRRAISNLQVADWAYIQSGVMHGGYSLRVQRSRLPEKERAAYDGFIGANSYAPLPAP